MVQPSFFSWQTLAIVLVLGTSSATPLEKRGLRHRFTGSANEATCFYNQGGSGGICWGSPNESYCQQSINSVCASLAGQQPGNDTLVTYSTGYGDNNNNGNEDCVALAGAGTGPTVSNDTCQQQFQELLGCYESTNNGFDSTCIGGTINVQFNTDKEGAAVNGYYPMFSLGAPAKGSQGPTANPPGTLLPDTTGAGSVGAASLGGAGRVAMGGLLGTDPE